MAGHRRHRKVRRPHSDSSSRLEDALRDDLRAIRTRRSGCVGGSGYGHPPLPEFVFVGGGDGDPRCSSVLLEYLREIEGTRALKFLAEIIAGRDPHFPPEVSKAAVGRNRRRLRPLLRELREAEGLRDPVTVKGRLKAVKAVLGGCRSPRWRNPATSFDSRLHIGRAAKSPL